MKKVLVLGDSIPFGLTINKDKSYIGLLKEKYKDITFTNLSVPSLTTSGLIKLLDLKLKISKKTADLIILAIGINDTCIINNREVNIGEFKENYNNLLNNLKRLNTRVLIIGLTNVVEELVSPYKGLQKKYFKNDRIIKFDKVIEESANEYNFKYIHLFKKLDENSFTDGLHPNEIGHLKIYNEIGGLYEENDNT